MISILENKSEHINISPLTSSRYVNTGLEDSLCSIDKEREREEEEGAQ